MFRKIVSILALLCFLGVSNFAMGYAYAPNTTWHGTNDANWFNAANWSDANYAPPGSNVYAIIESKFVAGTVGIVIDGSATCSALGICPWSWSNAPDMVVDLNSGDFNCGDTIMLAAQDLFNYGDNNNVGRAILVVHGGTVTTPRAGAAGTGLYIGGGGYGGYNVNNRGRVAMYGGLISVPLIALQNGDVNLYGGTLECTGGEANFAFFQNLPNNKIDISGGTLRLDSNSVTTLTNYISSGRIYSARGTIGVPYCPPYDGPVPPVDINTTVTSSDNNMIRAWNPSPVNLATNVHYYHSDGNSITLSWTKGDYDANVIDQNVYFGTASGTLVFQGTRHAVSLDSNGNGLTDPCNWTIKDPNKFTPGATYYWRVDEINTVSSACATGKVWSFTTHDGNAYNPSPPNAGIGTPATLREPLQLSWTAGDFAKSTGGHRVYFGTSYLNANAATTAASKYNRTTQPQTGTSYKIQNLYPDFVLTPGTLYYWRVDEVNANNTAGTLKGKIWSFSPGLFVIIDDFEDYNSPNEINAVWLIGGVSSCSPSSATGNGTLGYYVDTTGGKSMQYAYKDNGGSGYFSEVNRPYATDGISFTGGGAISSSLAPKALRIDYKGAATNAVDPTYDRMYVVLQDAAGNVAIYDNPDANAALVTAWTSWFSSLYDINALGIDTSGNPSPVNLNAITGFKIGFGVRCNYMPPDPPATVGTGTVLFDNIGLYAQTCNPDYELVPPGDLDRDCDVDINDLQLLANAWLNAATDINFAALDPPIIVTAPATPPVLWYKFEDTGDTNIICVDSSGNGYHGTIQRMIPMNHNIGGGPDGSGCLYIPPTPTSTGTFPTNNESYVTPPVTALDFMTNDAHSVANLGGGISFAMWANASMVGDFLAQWPGIFSTWNSGSTLETLEMPCPSRIGPSGSGLVNGQYGFFKRGSGASTFISVSGYRPLMDFGGRWNHWAFVKSPYQMAVYLNGQMIGHTDANDMPGDPNFNVQGPLFSMPVGAFYIGCRNPGWAMWSGKIDDFQVYDYALAPEEVAYLATYGTGHIFLPLASSANLKVDGVNGNQSDPNQIVNFGDLAIMGQDWHKRVLWP